MPTPQMSPNMSGNDHTCGAAGPACRASPGDLARPAEHRLATWPALQSNSLAHSESPSQLHFGLQDAKVPSLPAMIRFRGDPHVLSPSWGNSLCARTSSSAACVIRCPLEHPPSNQLGLQTHKGSDSLSFGQEGIS